MRRGVRVHFTGDVSGAVRGFSIPARKDGQGAYPRMVIRTVEMAAELYRCYRHESPRDFEEQLGRMLATIAAWYSDERCKTVAVSLDGDYTEEFKEWCRKEKVRANEIHD